MKKLLHVFRFVRFQEQPRFLELFQNKEHVGGECVGFLNQFFRDVVGALVARLQFVQYILIEGV